MNTFEFPQPVNGVYILTAPKSDFEQVYLDVRSKEHRLPDDSFVALLPVVPKTHPHAHEWQLRKRTADRFVTYLQQHPKGSILEIGCGNGWFSHIVSNYATAVTGLDVGITELEQAARCFSLPHLKFVCCTDWSVLPEQCFDIIVFNASYQYFVHDSAFWQSLYRLLRPQGEIHILDSPFYHSDTQQEAHKRSESYFLNMGLPEASS